MSETRKSLVIETALVVGLSLALLLFGTLVYLLLAGQQDMLDSLPLYLAATLGWRSVIWVLATVLIAVLLRNGSRRRRMGWGILAAAVAVTAGELIRFGPSIMYMGQGIVFAVVPWLLGLAVFVVCALLGWVLAIRLLDAPPGGRRALVAPVAIVLLLVLGGAGILSLLGQWFGLYFRIWSAAIPHYDDFGPEGTRYLVTAGLSIVALLAALVVAGLRGAKGLSVLSAVLLAACLLFGYVFQVPQGRFVPEPPTNELPSDYTPCFGGPYDTGCEGG